MHQPVLEHNALENPLPQSVCQEAPEIQRAGIITVSFADGTVNPTSTEVQVSCLISLSNDLLILRPLIVSGYFLASWALGSSQNKVTSGFWSQIDLG